MVSSYVHDHMAGDHGRKVPGVVFTFGEPEQPWHIDRVNFWLYRVARFQRLLSFVEDDQIMNEFLYSRAANAVPKQYIEAMTRRRNGIIEPWPIVGLSYASPIKVYFQKAVAIGEKTLELGKSLIHHNERGRKIDAESRQIDAQTRKLDAEARSLELKNIAEEIRIAREVSGWPANDQIHELAKQLTSATRALNPPLLQIEAVKVEDKS